MNNKNRLFRVTSLLLVLCFVSTVMISGTFAKYTSEYAGADTALVARWSFTGTFDGANMSGTNIALPIWDHNYTTNIYQKEVNDYLIAPGVQGSFEVEFTYDADVDADLIFNFTKSGDGAENVPIQYSLDNFATISGIYYSLDDLENAIIDTATNSTITGSNGTYEITNTAVAEDDPVPVTISETVSWKWPYDVEDHVGTTQTTDFPGTGTGSAWTDVDDVIAGNSSKLANRDSYVLNLQIKATQKTPATS